MAKLTMLAFASGFTSRPFSSTTACQGFEITLGTTATGSLRLLIPCTGDHPGGRRPQPDRLALKVANGHLRRPTPESYAAASATVRLWPRRRSRRSVGASILYQGYFSISGSITSGGTSP